MTLEEHKVYLGKILSNNSVKPKSKRGSELIWAYWMGVIAHSQKDWPYVEICLTCGRTDELQTPPKAQ